MTERDNLALCAMQVLLKKTVTNHIPFKQRVKKFFGMDYYTITEFNSLNIARSAYNLADAMLAVKDATEEGE